MTLPQMSRTTLSSGRVCKQTLCAVSHFYLLCNLGLFHTHTPKVIARYSYRESANLKCHFKTLSKVTEQGFCGP